MGDYWRRRLMSEAQSRFPVWIRRHCLHQKEGPCNVGSSQSSCWGTVRKHSFSTGRMSLGFIALCLDKSRIPQRNSHCKGPTMLVLSMQSPPKPLFPLSLMKKRPENCVAAIGRSYLHLAHSAKRHSRVIFKFSA